MITLEQVEYIITELALKHNLVGSAFAGPSIYALNAEDIKEYPFIYISPTGSHTLKENTTRFTFTIFAVDRLLEDSSNEDNIGSVSVETIRNLHLQLKKLEFVTDIQDQVDVRLFTETERLSDRCAGAYATLWLEVLNSTTCASFFDEYEGELGNYLPENDLLNILDSLASKNWVVNYLKDHGSGVDEKEVKRLIKDALKDYTKTNKFATINGSGITDEEVFNLLETSAFEQFLSGYTQEVLNIYATISAATPEDYEELRTQVSANTDDIRTLSGATESLSGTVSGLSDGFGTLSGTVVGNVEKIADISGATDQNTEDISNLSAFTSGLSFTVSEHTEDIEQLSGATQSIGSDLGDLSGFTAQAVSSLTLQVESLSGATSDAFSGLSGDIAELSGVTGGLEAQVSALTANDNVVIFDLRNYGTGITVTDDIYQGMVSAHTAGKHIFLVANVALTEHNSHLYVLPSTAPAEIFYDDNDDIYFRFCFVTDLPGVPDGIYVSKAAEFRKNYSSGLIHNVEEEFYVVDLDWRILREATPTEFGAVKLGSGMTQTTYGVANVAIGSGLTFDAEGNVTNPYTGNVESQSVTKIWSGSLQAYQDLGTYSNDTLYLII